VPAAHASAAAFLSDVASCALLRASGVRTVCLAGYPEGHSRLGSVAASDAVLVAKARRAMQAGFAVVIVSQVGCGGRDVSYTRSLLYPWLIVNSLLLRCVCLVAAISFKVLLRCRDTRGMARSHAQSTGGRRFRVRLRGRRGVVRSRRRSERQLPRWRPRADLRGALSPRGAPQRGPWF
jgi:hypothetical protein